MKKIIEENSIAIVMCTYNGEKYIKRQIDSILNQSLMADHIYISDDNSTDRTQKIISEINIRSLIISKNTGESGAASNFLGLIKEIKTNNDYFAFSDQDDIWLPNHLYRAISSLDNLPKDIPLLFCSRTLLINDLDEPIGLSNKIPYSPSFRNALIQNIASGNTMVFNMTAKKILAELAEHGTTVWHDWTLYQIVTACGGIVKYSDDPTVLYRQHNNNVIGARAGLLSIFKRINLTLHGRFKDWNTINIESLELILSHMTPENKKTIMDFKEARTMKTGFQRVFRVKKIGLYRQTILDQIFFYIAAFIGKI